MYNLLYKFFIENNILYQKQFRFQNAHSTDHAILQIVNQITEAFSQEKCALWILIDLSKAFDAVNAVWCSLLVEKLKAYGVQSENLTWIRSYLRNRKQFISLDDVKTEIKIVRTKNCAPQGSVLGLLLFLIFVNDHNNSTKVFDPVFVVKYGNLFCSNNNIILSLRQQTKNWVKLMVCFLQINYP